MSETEKGEKKKLAAVSTVIAFRRSINFRVPDDEKDNISPYNK